MFLLFFFFIFIHRYEHVKFPTYDFGNIQQPEFRLDYPLLMAPWNTKYFENVMDLLFPVLEKMLGADAELVDVRGIDEEKKDD